MFFGTVTLKNIDGKPWYSLLPLLSMKFSDARNFLKHRRITLENVSVLWDKKFRRRNVISPPFFSMIFVPYQKVSETQNGSSRRFSVLWDWNYSKENRDTRSFPPVIHEIFRQRKLSGAQKDYSPKCFGTVRKKISEGKSWYLSIRHKFFRHPNFSPAHKCSTRMFFGNLGLRFFDAKSWYPPNMHNFLRYPEFLETIKGSPRNVSSLWDKKNQENRATPIIHKHFSDHNISETQKGSPRRFSALWDKNFPTEDRDTRSIPTASYPRNFPTPETFSNTEGLLHENFGTVRQTKKKSAKSC